MNASTLILLENNLKIYSVTGAFSEQCQTTKIEVFAKITNGF